MGQIFALDANVFIEAARRYYAFDLVPRFWQVLIDQAATGQMRSIDRVQQELLRGNDELAEWSKGEYGDAFDTTDDAAVVADYRLVMTWAQGQPQFTDAAKAEFARVADGWLVAHAKAHGCTVLRTSNSSRMPGSGFPCRMHAKPLICLLWIHLRCCVHWGRVPGRGVNSVQAP